jgi:hypothetical protein
VYGRASTAGQARLESAVETARRTLGEPAAAAAWAAGQAMPLEQAVAYALEENTDVGDGPMQLSV